MSRVGRNERCPCGSGQKYKNCHGVSPDGGGSGFFSIDLTSLSHRERWLFFIEEVCNQLGLPPTFTAEELRFAFRAEHVAKINKLYERIIGDHSDPFRLPKPRSDSLSALYLGDVQEHRIRRNILRMSLYADEIFVADPFLHPRWTIPKVGNPISDPDSFVVSTYQAVYFLVRLAPWIKAGIVTPLVNPTNYDLKYRQDVFSQMESIVAANVKDEELDEDLRSSVIDLNYFDELFAVIPESELRRAIKSVFGEMPNDLVQDFEKLLKERRLSRTDMPHATALSGLSSQMMFSRGGFDPATAALISSRLGAFPISETKTNLKMLNALFEKPNQTAETWTPLAGAFRDTTLDFLDDVDPSFAISLRNDGRLHSFRQMLRGIWGTVTNTSDLAPRQIDVVRLSDQLRAEHEKAKAEWSEIRAKAAKWGVLSATTILGGTLALNVPSYFAAGGILVDAYQHWKSRKAFKIRNPASVLMDLQRRSRKKP